MLVATWNINGLRARLDFLIHWLRRRQPDIVGLQELKLTDDQFPHEAFEAEGYHALVHGQKAWNGVAILSRTPAEILQIGLPGEEEQGARLISALVDRILFTTVYCPNGKSLEHPDFQRKLTWFDSLIQLLKENCESEAPRILCGDFNICPEPADSWNEGEFQGSIFHTDEERARFRGLLDCGLADLFRQLNSDTQAFSWWDYRAGAFYKNQGLRIDMILGSSAVSDRLRSAEIDRDFRKKQEGLTASDHAPVLVELDG